MIPSNITSLLDDGLDCWMTVFEAAAYTRTGPAEVVRALVSEELVGVQTPAGGLLDCLLSRSDLDMWLELRVSTQPPA